jgi:hypothetical protein
VSAPVVSAPPPKAVLRVINPIFRTLLNSRFASAAPPTFVVLRFTGRRTGRRYDIVVGWHEVAGERVVFSPSLWAVNFRGGRPVEVVRAPRRLRGTGTLVEDPELIAPKLQQVVEGASPRDVGLKMRPGHRITPDDVRAVRRRMIRLNVS